MDNLVHIRNLSKHYDDFDLKGIDLIVPAGSVVGFIGSNGAGKTTTIKALLGLIFPDSGSIELFDTTVDTHTPSSTITSLKQRIGVVFDACSFPEEMTVRSVGGLMSYAYRAWNKEVFAQYLQEFDLPESKMVKDLSRGMGMKLMVACALSHNPDLLVLDEATAGLDPMAREEVLDTLRTYMKDERHGILISSHITSDLEKIADYIVCVDEGQVVFSVEKDAITDRAGIARCRVDDFENLAASGFFDSGTLHYLKHTYGIDVLVEDRFAFGKRFGNIVVDKADIETYMTLRLKGGLQ